jgi:hypothetical protein
MAQALGQVIAAEAAARAEFNKRGGALHKQGQKTDLFNGFEKTYSPFAEAADGGDARSLQLPPEGHRVQLRAEDLLLSFMDEMRGAVDLAAAKDEANCLARADVVVDGSLLLEGVPATHLLHMEKVLEDFATFVAKLPVLDPSVHWDLDADTRLRRAPESFTNREEVRPEVVIVAPATKEHPAQATTYQMRVAVGRWTTVRWSGALTEERKRELERRVSALKVAFKQARELANRVQADSRREADAIFAYILG